MYKVKHSRKLKKFKKAICAIFDNLAEEFVSTSIGETRFYMNFPRANETSCNVFGHHFRFPCSELLGTSPTHKNKEKSLVLNNKVVPSPATAPKFDRRKACTNISKGVWVDVTAFVILL